MTADRFTLIEELGRGAMGVVWRAADHAQGSRIVALKTIRADSVITAEQRLRFKEEFRAMARLRHPNAIEVFDYGQLDAHTQFISMELVAGRELAALVATGPLPIDEVIRILVALAQVLGFIHSRRLVHRDIKAANVFVREDGTVKLMDFGLMAQLGQPATGGISGTPGYMAPELVRGGAIDGRTDLYALGCLAYELLTGALPFTGRVLDVVRAHVGTPVPPLARRRPDAPEQLVALVHRLLEKDPAARPIDAAALLDDLTDLAGPAAARPTLEQRKSYLVAGSLIGRDEELRALSRALADAQAGHGRAVYLDAPAGVGKSRLVQELTVAAKLADLPVLTSPCHEAGMAPYEGVVAALRTLEAVSTAEERAAHAAVLERLARPGAPLDAEARRRANAEVTAWLSAVAARTPLLWVVEDAHWADAGTIDVLNHLAAMLAGIPVAILVTLRGDETPAGSPARAPIAEGQAALLPLAPFDGGQVRALIEAMLGPIVLTPEYGRYFVEATGGNAFFVTEALRTMMEDQVLAYRDGVWHFPTDTGNLALLTTVQATIARRLARLDVAARHVAETAAVIGRAPSRELLLEVGGISEDELFTALDELLERQFLIKDGVSFRFPHDRVRETLHAELAPRRRAELHGRCGAALARREGTPLAVLARHYGQGPDLEQAYAYARRAGDAARDAGATEVALDHWLAAERALLAGKRGAQDDRLLALWWEIGKAAYYARPEVAIAAFERLVVKLEAACHAGITRRILIQEMKLVRRLPVRWQAAFWCLVQQRAGEAHRAVGRRSFSPLAWADAFSRAHLANGFLAVAYAKAGRPRKGLEVLERVVRSVSFAGTETVMEAAELVVQAPILEWMGRLDEAVAVARRVEAMAGPPGAGDHPLARVARIGAFGCQLAVALQGDRPDEAILAQHVKACEEAGDRHGVVDAWAAFALWHAATGRLDEAQAWLDRMAQHCRRIGEPIHPDILCLRPFVAFQAGEFEAALGLVRQGRLAPQLAAGEFTSRARLALLEGEARLALGEVDAAAAIFAEAIAVGHDRELLLDVVVGQLGRARVATVRGDRAAARADLEAALATVAAGPLRNPGYEAITARLLGELATDEARWADAEAALDRALAIATRQDNPLEQGQIHRARGRLQAARGDRPAAEAAYREAGERYYALRNRHHLHLVTRDLEALRGGPAIAEATAVVAPAPELVMERWANLLRI